MTRAEAELYPEWSRKIVERKKLDDVSEDWTLDCGHVMTLVCPPPWQEDYLECAQCLNAYIAKQKAKP